MADEKPNKATVETAPDPDEDDLDELDGMFHPTTPKSAPQAFLAHDKN